MGRRCVPTVIYINDSWRRVAGRLESWSSFFHPRRIRGREILLLSHNVACKIISREIFLTASDRIIYTYIRDPSNESFLALFDRSERMLEDENASRGEEGDRREAFSGGATDCRS